MSIPGLTTEQLKAQYGIGLTGGVACGKSTVAEIVRKEGYLVIDADVLARRAVEPGSATLKDVVAAFGPDVIADDGSLNRKALGQIIFQDGTARDRLEKIIHPAIHKLLQDELKANGLPGRPKFWFYEAALLFETGRARDFFEVWAVFCPLDVQMTRLQQRDGRSADMVKDIIASQLPAQEKAHLADIVIDTSSSKEAVHMQVRLALARLQQRFRK